MEEKESLLGNISYLDTPLCVDIRHYFPSSSFNLLEKTEGLSDNVMRAVFVTGATLYLGELTGFAHEGSYTHAEFGLFWNYVDALFPTAGMILGAKALKKAIRPSNQKKAVLAFDFFAAVALTIFNTLTYMAMQSPNLFGATTDTMLKLGAYGFALSMSASALHALNDMLSAYRKTNPANLLVNYLEKYQALNTKYNAEYKDQGTQNSSEAKELQAKRDLFLAKANALARAKRHEMELTLQTDTLCESFFNLYGAQFTSLAPISRAQQRADTFFANAELARQQNKCLSATINFTGYICASICFWLAATETFSMEMLTNPLDLATDTSVFLIFTSTFFLAAIIKLLQLIVPTLLAAHDLHQHQRMIDEFITEHSRGISTSADATSAQQWFLDQEITDATLKIKYLMAYKVSKTKLVGEYPNYCYYNEPAINLQNAFFQALKDDPHQVEILQTAVEEYIIKMSLETSQPRKNETGEIIIAEETGEEKFVGFDAFSALLAKKATRQQVLKAIRTNGFFPRENKNRRDEQQTVSDSSAESNPVTGDDGEKNFHFFPYPQD